LPHCATGKTLVDQIGGMATNFNECMQSVTESIINRECRHTHTQTLSLSPSLFLSLSLYHTHTFACKAYKSNKDIHLHNYRQRREWRGDESERKFCIRLSMSAWECVCARVCVCACMFA